MFFVCRFSAFDFLLCAGFAEQVFGCVVAPRFSAAGLDELVAG
jgi:hypothetical protein